MPPELTQTLRRINKYHDYLSREEDVDIKRAFLSALIEASGELGGQVS